jgi:hypothetical protein
VNENKTQRGYTQQEWRDSKVDVAGREATPDLHQALMDLSAAMNHPAMSVKDGESFEGELVRMATRRLREEQRRTREQVADLIDEALAERATPSAGDVRWLPSDESKELLEALRFLEGKHTTNASKYGFRQCGCDYCETVHAFGVGAVQADGATK